MKKAVNTFNVTFFVRKERVSQGKTQIIVSVNLNKQRMKVTSKLYVALSNWDSVKGYPRGSSLEIKQLAMKLNEIKNKYIDCYHELSMSTKSFSLEDIKNHYFGVKDAEQTLMKLFDYHLEISSNTLAQSTIKAYKVTQRYYMKFLEKNFRKTDICLSQLNLKFIYDFEQFVHKKNITSKNPCNHNAIIKHIVRLRKVVNLAIRNEWLEKDPFSKYKISYNPTNREFLTLQDLDAIENKEFSIQRLQIVKDLFIFSCYTGLAYVDVMNLKHENLCLGIDKKMWIKTTRTKTDIPVNLPILSKAADIIKRYEAMPFLMTNNHVLPNISNQKLNAYLKEIADICGITKPLTFHIARHTFATTVTLTNGVPIETVSKMLGHTSIKTTQIYAKVVDSKISHDMQTLEEKLENQLNSIPLSKTAN